MLMAGVEAQPSRQRSGDRTTTIQGDRPSDLIAPFRMPEEDRNQGSDIPSDGEIYGISGVLYADFDGRSIQHQPHQAKAGAAFRHPGEFKPKQNALTGQYSLV